MSPEGDAESTEGDSDRRDAQGRLESAPVTDTSGEDLAGGGEHETDAGIPARSLRRTGQTEQ